MKTEKPILPEKDNKEPTPSNPKHEKSTPANRLNTHFLIGVVIVILVTLAIIFI